MEKSNFNFVMESLTLICGIVIIGFFFLAAAPASAQVPVARVVTLDGKKIVGDYVTKNDSAVILRDWGKLVSVPFNTIDKMLLQGETFLMRDGEFVKLERLSAARVHPSNPNDVIANAFRSTGGVALGIGVPCLVTGAICLGVSYADGVPSNKKMRLGAAGSILLPVGCSLTIIGIPLTIHGKRIMDMNVKTSGTSAGLALVF